MVKFTVEENKVTVATFLGVFLARDFSVFWRAGEI